MAALRELREEQIRIDMNVGKVERLKTFCKSCLNKQKFCACKHFAIEDIVSLAHAKLQSNLRQHNYLLTC